MEGMLISQIFLWVVVVLLSLVVWALARQIGVLHERLAPVGALVTDRGLQVGETAPVLTVEDLQGGTVVIGDKRSDGRDLLLLFVAPGCPICKKLLPVVKAFVRQERGTEVVLAGDGAREQHERYIKEHGLESLRFVISAQIGLIFRVGKLPYAVLLDQDGVVRARGLVNSREHLESLFEARATGYASIQEYWDAQEFS